MSNEAEDPVLQMVLANAREAQTIVDVWREMQAFRERWDAEPDSGAPGLADCLLQLAGAMQSVRKQLAAGLARLEGIEAEYKRRRAGN